MLTAEYWVMVISKGHVCYTRQKWKQMNLQGGIQNEEGEGGGGIWKKECHRVRGEKGGETEK